MIKILFTILFSVLLAVNYLPQSNIHRNEPETPVRQAENIADEAKDQHGERSDSTENRKKIKPQILNLKADLILNEVILTWTLKNSSKIVNIAIDKMKDDESHSIAVINVNSYGDMASEFVQQDLLTEEEMESDAIIYRISGKDSAGQIILQRQIPISPSKELEFELFQNFPNPFNPVTTIKFHLSSQQYVTLKVFNILGNQVDVLVDEMKPAGLYEAEFSGSGMVSGVYLYALQIGDYTETKRMILMK